MDIKRLKRRDPTITDAIKAAKIVPNGSDVGFEEEIPCECAAFKAGVQKKTNRYMLPSKKQDARPRVKIRLSANMILSAFLGGGEDEHDDGDVCDW